MDQLADNLHHNEDKEGQDQQPLGQGGAGFPARVGLRDAFAQIGLVGVELEDPQLARSVSLCILIAQIPAHGVTRAVQLLRDRSDTLAPAGHYAYLHCLLLSQHQQPSKGRHRGPGGSFLLRR